MGLLGSDTTAQIRAVEALEASLTRDMAEQSYLLPDDFRQEYVEWAKGWREFANRYRKGGGPLAQVQVYSAKVIDWRNGFEKLGGKLSPLTDSLPSEPKRARWWPFLLGGAIVYVGLRWVFRDRGDSRDE